MIWAVIVLAVVCVLLALQEASTRRWVLRLQAEWALERREWSAERAALVNAAKGAMMPPPKLREVPKVEREEPKDLAEYATIGTIDFPPKPGGDAA